MREIKFRAWDILKKEMWLDLLRELGEFEQFEDQLSMWSVANMMTMGDSGRFVFEQYTGLHDKNGNEIYEGDILLTNEANWKAKVIWDYDGFMLTGLDNKGFSCSPDYDECEIIGNVHTNPELLEAL